MKKGQSKPNCTEYVTIVELVLKFCSQLTYHNNSRHTFEQIPF